MHSPAIRPLVHEFAAALRPVDPLPLSEWADRHRRLSPEASAQTGVWSTLAYQREPLDALSPHSPFETVVLMWGSQLGKTEMLLSLLAFIIAEDPGPVLIVQPNLAMAEAFSKDRIAPMLRDMPILAGKVANPRSRDAGSTIAHRQFLGGHVTVIGANSPAGLASRPIRYVLADELDRFPASAGSEGDPVSLAVTRSETFWNRKIILTSTPTVKGESRIAEAFSESDARFFRVPCPHCNHAQRLIWPRVEWPEARPDQARYRCEKCDRLIDHADKSAMVERGHWRATQPGASAAGFHLSSLVSPWRSWSELAVQWLQASGNPERRRVFINTRLAELWDDEGTRNTTEAELMARRENYGPPVPERAAILTAGVDVQADRAEVSVYAWGAGEESWLMTHRVIPGDPTGATLWAALDDFLAQSWAHPIAGQVSIHAAAIDSGAFTGSVTKFCDERRGRRIWAVKSATGPRPTWPKRESKAAKGKVFVIGIDSLRATVSARLAITEGVGRIHFPGEMKIEFAEQLLSEYLRTEYKRGRPIRIWERRKARRAEAWDCANYALAALKGLESHGVFCDVEASRLANMREIGAAAVQPARLVSPAPWAR